MVADIDDKVENFLMKEFFYLLRISSVFTYNKGNWYWIGLFHRSLFMFIMVSALFQLLYTALLLKDYDIGMSAMCFHASGGLFVTISILWLLSKYRCNFIRLTDFVYKDFYDYGPSYSTEEVKYLYRDLRKFKNRIFYYVLAIIMSIAFQIGVGIPVQDKIQGYGEKDELINDVFMHTPVPLWFPFHVDIYTAFAYQMAIASIELLVLCSGLFAIFYFTHNINIQLKILTHSIQKIEKRALKKCKDKYPHFRKHNIYKDKKFLKEYEYCVKQNVEHHQNILEAHKIVDEIQRWPMFNAVFFISLVMACALFILLRGDRRIAYQLLSFLLLMLEVASILVICWRGQELTDESNKVYSAFYGIELIFCPLSIKRSVLIMQEANKKELTYKAGGFTDINWELFGAIMNTAYSYFNLLLAMKDTL